MIERNITLSNGLEMPRIGLGTFKAMPDDISRMVTASVSSGIRLIDTASIYKNQEAIANALKSARVPREQVFITSKISPYEQGSEKSANAINDILSKLDTSYLDLLLIHWPGAHKQKPESPRNAQLRMETWQVIEDYYRAGKLRSIGVSNFEKHHLEHILTQSSIKPMVNQIEIHPRRPCLELRQMCEAHQIAVTAYGSLGCGDLLTKPAVLAAAEQCEGKTAAQVLLRWALKQGVAVIPKSTKPQRISSYSEDLILSSNHWTEKEDAAIFKYLSTLDDGHKYCWDSTLIL